MPASGLASVGSSPLTSRNVPCATSQTDTNTAKASVVTARYRPGMSNAGSRMRTGTAGHNRYPADVTQMSLPPVRSILRPSHVGRGGELPPAVVYRGRPAREREHDDQGRHEQPQLGDTEVARVDVLLEDHLHDPDADPGDQ